MPTKKTPPASVKDVILDEKINPQPQEKSLIETVPLMNEAVKSLYHQAQNYYQHNNFPQAIESLERAYEIQPTTPEVSQLLAEIYLQLGKHNQAHYWASIATKNGPSRGDICEKSWRILALAAEQLGYFANQAMALEAQADCLLIPAKRY